MRSWKLHFISFCLACSSLCLAFFDGVNFLVKAMASLELYEIRQSYFYVFVFF